MVLQELYGTLSPHKGAYTGLKQKDYEVLQGV